MVLDKIIRPGVCRESSVESVVRMSGPGSDLGTDSVTVAGVNTIVGRIMGGAPVGFVSPVG